MATRRKKVALAVSPKAPSTLEKLLDWVQKEVHQLLIQMRDVINNLADDVGGITSDTYKVKVDASDTPDYAEFKLVAGAGATVTKTGAVGSRSLTFAASGDHKFATDSTDEAAGGAGYALSKLSSTGNVKPTLDTTSAQRRTRFDVTLPTAYPGPMAPVGRDFAGNSGQWADGNHSHPNQDLVAPAVDAMHLGFMGCGTAFLFSGAWTEGPTGTWTRNATGAYPSTFCDDVTPFQGMLLLAWNDGLDTSELRKAGLYQLTALGGLGTNAVMTRTATVLVHGLLAYVKGGTIHAGQTWKLQTDDPIVADTTDQEWVLANAGGSTGDVDHRSTTHRDAANQHPDTSIDPTIENATMVAGDKLALGTSITLLVTPAGHELGLIETPTVAAGKTAFRRLIFTGATKLHNAATPTTGYSPLKLGRGGTIKDTIVFGAAYASAEFTYVPSADLWVLGAMNST